MAPGAWALPETPATNHWWSPEVDIALDSSGTNRVQWDRALNEVPQSQREGLQFLLENMPKRDLQTLPASMILENITLAYSAFEAAPWSKAIPHDIFLNDILPYASISETREAWRKPLFDLCAPIVKECKTPAQAAQRINETLFGLVKVKYSTARKKADQSPSESMETGLASCTGLSILLLDACRSVGVPARLAGIPNWIDNRGNHTWVEVWDERWHFIGAAEPDARGLDHAWFEADAALADKNSPEHSIYAASFKKTSVPFPSGWDPRAEPVSAVNVTDRYKRSTPTLKTGKTRLLVRVMDEAANQRIIAQVRVFDPKDADCQFTGSSRDERSDANDLLSFEVPQERSYMIEAKWGTRETKQAFQSHTNSQSLVILTFPAAPSASAAATSPAACSVTPVAKPLKASQEAKLKKQLTAFFKATPEQQARWKFPSSLDSLLKNNEPAVRKVAWDAYTTAPLHDALKQDFQHSQVRFQNYLSPYTVKFVGSKPQSGWPLFIAMHGGGGTAKEVNDSQWKIMETHYREQPEVGGYCYLALRAPNDTWNGFYDDYVYPLIANLIKQQVLFAQIDPDKVFIMGYSHGGYGAFAIGPKMPDHFAAVHASAGAPTDGETSALNLRNTRFTYMIGENDNAYDRLKRCRAFDEKITKLRGERTDIYPVTMDYKAGKAHSDLPDRDMIKPMYSALRQSAPAELTWELTDTVIHDFYWLQVPQPSKNQELAATCRANQIKVTSKNVSAANLYLDSRLIDFNQPVQLNLNGNTTSARLKPSLLVLCQTLLERADPQLAFTARLKLPMQAIENKK